MRRFWYPPAAHFLLIGRILRVNPPASFRARLVMRMRFAGILAGADRGNTGVDPGYGAPSQAARGGGSAARVTQAR